MRGLWAIAATLTVTFALPVEALGAPPSECPGDPIDVDESIGGKFDSERQGSFVFVPFDVPEGTTSVRAKYCFDQPEAPTSAAVRHTLDLGLYEPRDTNDDVWKMDEFRGWGGSGYGDVTVTPQGFSSEAQYLADRKAHVPGRTTRSFRPGPIPAGEWAAELGLAAIADESLGDTDGKVGYRVEIELRDDPGFADDPYRPKRYDAGSVRSDRGWYAGDFHVHGEHSGDSDATMTETFRFAFRSIGRGGAGLDFVSLTDHNTDTAWSEIGRYQDDHPEDLIMRGQEVTTYRGHANQHASGEQVDYRTGPLFVREPGGSLDRVRRERPPKRFIDDVDDSGGFSQINHPTIFPSSVPIFALLCRGCSWEYSDGATDYTKVDAVEIATGPPGLQGPTEIGPNPFTTTGIDFWEDKLADGHKLAAVGSSDSHDAGEPDGATEAPIGTATTVVRAERLSERGVRCAVEAGHTYVKVTGADGPDVRLEDRGSNAIMGDTIEGRRAKLRARVIDGAGTELVILKDNVPFETRPVTDDDFELDFEPNGPGRYRLQLQRASTIDTVSSPIYLDPDGGERRGCDSAGDGDRFTRRHGP